MRHVSRVTASCHLAHFTDVSRWCFFLLLFTRHCRLTSRIIFFKRVKTIFFHFTNINLIKLVSTLARPRTHPSSPAGGNIPPSSLRSTSAPPPGGYSHPPSWPSSSYPPLPTSGISRGEGLGEAGDWRLQTGDGRLEIGDWRQERR